MIEVENLSKSFGAVRAVDGVSFAVPDGRITGLLGPNGAGKSTTLRAIATVLRPDGGSARIDDIDAAERPAEARRCLGVLPHAAGLYPRLTGRENIRYFGRLAGLRRGELERRIEELVVQLAMADFVDRRAGGYSQGQRLKAALGRVLVHGPRNLVLDEPTNGLDVMAARSLRELLRHLRDEGHCVLLSSHVMQEVEVLCDGLVVVDRGRVVATGSPEEMRRRAGSASLEDAFVAALGTEEHRP